MTVAEEILDKISLGGYMNKERMLKYFQDVEKVSREDEKKNAILNFQKEEKLFLESLKIWLMDNKCFRENSQEEKEFNLFKNSRLEAIDAQLQGLKK